jgi:hypothetical protein
MFKFGWENEDDAADAGTVATSAEPLDFRFKIIMPPL